jgi:hypothetical protein
MGIFGKLSKVLMELKDMEAKQVFTDLVEKQEKSKYMRKVI